MTPVGRDLNYVRPLTSSTTESPIPREVEFHALLIPDQVLYVSIYTEHNQFPFGDLLPGQGKAPCPVAPG